MYGNKGEVPDDPDFTIPLGVADVKREGTDVTIVRAFIDGAAGVESRRAARGAGCFLRSDRSANYQATGYRYDCRVSEEDKSRGDS